MRLKNFACAPKSWLPPPSLVLDQALQTRFICPSHSGRDAMLGKENGPFSKFLALALVLVVTVPSTSNAAAGPSSGLVPGASPSIPSAFLPLLQQWLLEGKTGVSPPANASSILDA